MKNIAELSEFNQQSDAKQIKEVVEHCIYSTRRAMTQRILFVFKASLCLSSIQLS